ncbi:MAG: hypothetical protein COB51_08780 [Moraxellaceae bacterium]|nr:MAG: hypothetical protein COB51_08780 [Moraxellaceae bacterium]
MAGIKPADRIRAKSRVIKSSSLVALLTLSVITFSLPSSFTFINVSYSASQSDVFARKPTTAQSQSQSQAKPQSKPAPSQKSEFEALRQKALPLISRQLKRQEENHTQPAFKYPFIAIIIDDIGYSPYLGSQAINLPGPVTYSVLPHTPNGFRLAKQAYYLGKEVMLHAPMESVNKKKLGHGGLPLSMTEEQFLHTLREDLSQIPFLAGVNNHMGSLLTQHPEPMGWFMEEIMHRGMYFVDSRTTPSSVAANTAEEFNIPYLIRDVFLDNDPTLWGVHKSFLKLIEVARREGSAIAIGHPYPSTLAYLAEAIPTLKKRGITLIPVSEMLETQTRKTVHYFSKPKDPSPQTASSEQKTNNGSI